MKKKREIMMKTLMTMKTNTMRKILVPIPGMKKKRMKRKMSIITAAVGGEKITIMSIQTVAGEDLRNADANQAAVDGDLPPWTATSKGGLPVKADGPITNKEEDMVMTKAVMAVPAAAVPAVARKEAVLAPPTGDGPLNHLPIEVEPPSHLLIEVVHLNHPTEAGLPSHRAGRHPLLPEGDGLPAMAAPPAAAIPDPPAVTQASNVMQAANSPAGPDVPVMAAAPNPAAADNEQRIEPRALFVYPISGRSVQN
jgi:hypothetical protein